MSETFSITINEKEYQVSAGQTVLEVAFENGIEIPNLCHDARLVPTGSCRLCVVEVEGQRTPVPACTFAVGEGMVVKTDTEELFRLRKTVLELLFYEHRGVCTTCDENGECRLQRYGYEYQLSDSVFQLPEKGVEAENYTTGNEAIHYRTDKCIRCGRCIRICEEVQMDSALTFKKRASSVEVTTAFDMPLNDSTCELCGQCVSTCPTGALYERAAEGKGQCTDLKRTRTTCVYCGVGCQIDLNTNDKNEIVRVTSPVGVIPNNGNLCVKGRFGMDFVGSDQRLTTPLIKRNGKFKSASWEEAIKFIAERLGQIKDKYGADTIAGLSSAKCTNEDNYVFQKFIRAVVGTNNVDHCARLCHASTVAGLARAFGSGAMTNSIDEFKNAECIFVIGSNTTEAHPVIGLYMKEAIVKNGAKLIVADPRAIDLVRFAQLHIAQKPGTDVALINAMMNVIISEGLHDKEFIEERTEDFDKLAAEVKDFTPEKAAEITTIDADLIRKAARTYAGASSSSIVYSMGITQHTTGTDNVLSLANLAMLTGNVGKECSGVNPLRGQNNVQGACDLGALPNVYPGYQSVEDEAIKAKFEGAWGCELSDKKGLTVVEMMHSILEGKVKALYIMGENPALSDPNLNMTRKALDEVEFLVSQDIFLTETGEYADVVFPFLHGPNGEDGTLQGYLELLRIPYVGNSVLSSALCMDKAMTKRVLSEAGIPVVPFIELSRGESPPDLLTYPLFVKPATLGSSVGISMVVDESGLPAALEEAFYHSKRILIEPRIEGRELECSVLGNDFPEAALPGEVIPQLDFYDYETKLHDETGEKLKLDITAELPDQIADEVKELAIATFIALKCEGMARVDFFYTPSGELLVNEVNSIPGFTPVSLFPLTWEASGLPFSDLLDRLIELALRRHGWQTQMQ